MDRAGETTIARFLSRIQRIRLALRDGDAECKDLEQKIRRSKLALEKQLLREKKAIETEQKYKVGFAKVKLRLEEEKDREQEMLRQLREVRANYSQLLNEDAATRRQNQQTQLSERAVQKKLTEAERSLRENRTRYDRLKETTARNREKYELATAEVSKLSATLTQLREDISSLQNYVTTKM